MKVGILLLAVAAIGAALFFGGFLAPPASHLLVTQATATPMQDGAAAVLTIENQGAPDELAAVSSPDAEVVLHNADMGLPIQTGVSSLAMDAAHILVTPLAADFEDGRLIPLTLTFANAGDVSVKARYSTPDPNSMAGHMAMGHGSMGHPVGEEPRPNISLSAERVEGGWIAQVATKNFTFSEAMQDGDHVPGTGHGHIYLGGMKLGRVFSDSYRLGALPAGQHVLRVTLNTNDHRAYVIDGQPISAETVITVD